MGFWEVCLMRERRTDLLMWFLRETFQLNLDQARVQFAYIKSHFEQNESNTLASQITLKMRSLNKLFQIRMRQTSKIAVKI